MNCRGFIKSYKFSALQNSFKALLQASIVEFISEKYCPIPVSLNIQQVSISLWNVNSALNSK